MANADLTHVESAEHDELENGDQSSDTDEGSSTIAKLNGSAQQQQQEIDRYGFVGGKQYTDPSQ